MMKDYKRVRSLAIGVLLFGIGLGISCFGQRSLVSYIDGGLTGIASLFLLKAVSPKVNLFPTDTNEVEKR